MLPQKQCHIVCIVVNVIQQNWQYMRRHASCAFVGKKIDYLCRNRRAAHVNSATNHNKNKVVKQLTDAFIDSRSRTVIWISKEIWSICWGRNWQRHKRKKERKTSMQMTRIVPTNTLIKSKNHAKHQWKIIIRST